MIDVDQVLLEPRGREGLEAFFTALYRGLLAERRMSTLVRVRIAGDQVDFRVSYSPRRGRASKTAVARLPT